MCIVASAGGHLSQLLRLTHVWQDRDVFCITTNDLMRRHLQQAGAVCIVGECNRRKPLMILSTVFSCARVLIRARPNVIISTGAAPGCIACFIGKALGAKVVWIDSITNVEKLSLSGRIVRHIADLFLVQWPHLAQRYRGVEYVGAVI